MTDLSELLNHYVETGYLPGAVALVARGDDVRAETAGTLDAEGAAPMTADSIFRFASITKPITAAAVLMLIEEGVLGLDEPVQRWLPELADRVVVRTPESPVGDVVPARRPITVADLLTSCSGYGFASDFSLPQVQRLLTVDTDGREVQQRPAPDEWLAALARLPLLHHPGEAFLYNTSSDLQGILIARASGRSLPEFLAQRLLDPLGMTDTGFVVPEADRSRFTSYYRPAPDGGLELADTPDGQWSRPQAFPSGAGGLAGTAGDWLRFARMLLAGGVGEGGRLLSAESVRQMTTNHLTASQRATGSLFLDGQGWGYGGGVDLTHTEPWQIPGRYGWVGGSGTSAHLIPATGEVAILLTQRGMADPTPTPILRDFWRCVAGGPAGFTG
ncbi:serine hydrolase domain-containing protein [Amycolatopsis panacis]|uniref:Class A beta-lactamase-related serine hydrolase n=1 Tax=Amycolatopsis panacis TaxID=2340917 RepID=A0A419I8B2_9PSEU|nr:serine hydrolase domain-containing protein [Amycolatopsis panacis]RJQ88185.1 class A beta-lactamase-related serine hydrolase [Amycolatopsis panacis]